MIPSPRRVWMLFAAWPGTHRAMVFAVVSTVCAATGNGIIRSLSGEMHPFEITFFRCVLGVLIFVPIIWRIGLARVKTDGSASNWCAAAFRVRACCYTSWR